MSLPPPRTPAVSFCETAEHVRQTLERNGEFRIVALTPEVAWACQRLGIEYSRVDDFTLLEEFATQKTDLWCGVIEWVEWVDGFLAAAFPQFDSEGFNPARACVCFFYIFFAEFYASTRILDRFFSVNRPPRVLYWPPPEHLPSLTLREHRPVYASLLPLIAQKHGADLIAGDASRPLPASIAPRPAPLGRLRRLQMRFRGRLKGRLLEESRLIARHGISAVARSLISERGTGARILFLGSGYDLDPLAMELRVRGVTVRWLSARLPADAAGQDSSAESVRCRLEELWPSVIGHEAFARLLRNLGIPPIAATDAALARWWTETITVLWSAHRSARILLQYGQWRGVIAGNGGSGGLEGVILGTAARLGIPGIVYTHGGSSNICEWGVYDCLLNARHLLAYGPGTVEFLEHVARTDPRFAAGIWPVGSARVDGLLQQFRSRDARTGRGASLRSSDPRPIVLYVPTHYNGYGRAFSELAAYPDISYFELQQKILSLFARYPGVRVLYKDFPVADSPWNPIPDFIAAHIPNGQTTLTRLTELLPAVDAIIVDHAITAAGEALATDKPVIVYDRRSRPDLRAASSAVLLRKRAVVAQTEDEFVACVEDFLCKGDFRPLSDPDDEFLHAFCTFNGDGQSVSRAADAVMRATLGVSDRPNPVCL